MSHGAISTAAVGDYYILARLLNYITFVDKTASRRSHPLVFGFITPLNLKELTFDEMQFNSSNVSNYFFEITPSRSTDSLKRAIAIYFYPLCINIGIAKPPLLANQS